MPRENCVTRWRARDRRPTLVDSDPMSTPPQEASSGLGRATPPAEFAAYGADDVRLLRQAIEVARGAAACLHPRRLILGLFLLLVLMQLGWLYDRSTEPRFGPSGLFADDPAEDREAAIAEAWAVIAASSHGDDPDAMPPADPAEWRSLVTTSASGIVEASRVEGVAPEYVSSAQGWLAILARGVPRGTFAAASEAFALEFASFCRSAIALRWSEAASSLGRMTLGLPDAIWRHDRMFFLGFGLPAVVLTSFFGGMLARLAACRFGRREWITIPESADFAASSVARLVSAPLLPIVVALFPLGVIALLGFLLRLPVLDAVGGALFGVPLALSLLASLLLLGLLVSWPLVVPAVACEDADAADCVQRAYAAVVHRPGRFVVLGAAAVLGLVVGVAMLDAVIVATLAFTAGSLSQSAPATLVATIGSRGWLEFGSAGPAVALLEAPWSGYAIAVWTTTIRWLVGGFVLAWLFDAGTRIYLFLREQVDGSRPEAIASLPSAETRSERMREAIEAARRAR
jgi:hypothetical protein